ncbi:MAG: RNA methyltransferase [Dysgonamonadaceae bacterium]|jgi:TrmH family RNA methyltransferase|nr:RNA methyltransferase [Dysgonamonadaceae bacterium]
MEIISSLQNSRIKNIVRLSSKAKERKEQGIFLIEGARELSLALTGGYVPDSVFICRELFAHTDYPHVLDNIPGHIRYEIARRVYEKIAYRENADGILALAQMRTHRPDDLHLPENPFLILLEAVEKPGNLGAILRTADAAKVDGVIVCDPSTDIYNPNTVRSSVGCLFTVPLAVCSSSEALSWLKARGIHSFAADLAAGQWYHETDFTQSSAIIMGTEADGLSAFWLENAEQRIKIPMRGAIDSLNVSVSTAIITFEAMRQRSFKL